MRLLAWHKSKLAKSKEQGGMGMNDKKREKGGRAELRAGFRLRLLLRHIDASREVAPLPSVQFFPQRDPPAER